jgi:hypothetical protein
MVEAPMSWYSLVLTTNQRNSHNGRFGNFFGRPLGTWDSGARPIEFADDGDQGIGGWRTSPDFPL